MSKMKTKEQFIHELEELFGNRYDTSQVEYCGAHKKVKIICPEHGEFWISPHSVLSQKRACPKCGFENARKNIMLNEDDVIRRIKEIHGDKYDLSKIRYNGICEKVELICKKHGSFWIRPHNIINGKQGCPLCAIDSRTNKTRKTKEQFIEEAKMIHGDKYDYSKVEYINRNTKVCIICHEKDPITGKKHGEFWQTPSDHIFGKCGCPRCSNNPHYTVQDYIEKASIIHKNKYSYELLPDKFESYSHKKILVTCPKHGPFGVLPNTHLCGCGCPICKESKLEIRVNDLLKRNGIEFRRQEKFEWLRSSKRNFPMPLDFFIPSINTAIECQGREHLFPIDFFGGDEGFKETLRRDNEKFMLCNSHGIKILYFTDIEIEKYPYEVIKDESILIDMLKNMGA